MTASDDARAAIAAVLIPDGVHVKPSAAPYVLDVPMPDGRTIAATLDALAEVEAERDVARKGTEDAIGELQYERKMRAENLRALWDAEAERDALRAALTNAANEAALRFTGEMLRLDDENRKLRTAILETLAYAPNGDPDCAHSAGDGTTGLCVHCGFNPALDRLDLAAEARP